MKINNELILKWIKRISSVKGIQMDPDALADDIFLMAYVYKDSITFEMAMENVVKSLNLLATNQIDSSHLFSNYTGWSSYHFQSRRTQGQRADLQIIFQKHAGFIRVRGFGNRWVPADIYHRLRPRE